MGQRDRKRAQELEEDIEFIEQQLRCYAEPKGEYQRRVQIVLRGMLASKRGYLELLRHDCSF